MSKTSVQRIAAILLVASLLVVGVANLAAAAPAKATLAQQSVLRAKTIKGTIVGGKFATIWLGLEPEGPNVIVSLVADWDRADALQNGLGFVVLDENGLKRVGEGTFPSIALAAGDPNSVVNGSSNQQGASFNASAAAYTLVIYNDSAVDANFTLKATGAAIVDGSNQVSDPTAAPAATTAPAAASEQAAAPATTSAVTTTTTTTATQVAAVAAPVTATAPAAVAGKAPVIRVKELKGELVEENAQHFLGLEPSQRDAEITLSMTFDPQDSAELARRMNFWVLTKDGFAKYLDGSNPGDVAIATGNRTFRGECNERIANFTVSGTEPLVVILYNNSRVPGSYTLKAEGGLLVDDSGQTLTAQQAAPAAAPVAATVATTTTATTTKTVTTGTTTSTTTTAATTTAATGQAGGTYTVKAGDTLATIARDIYGDLKLYQQICTFNGIANCDLIEVGDIVKLPTQAQITSGATAPAAATTTTTAAKVTPVAVQATKPTTTTTTTTSAPVATTTAVTTTTPVSATNATTPTTSAGATTPLDLVETAKASGDFTTLITALQKTGLDKTLKGKGPFTLFAPTDAAFAALPAAALNQLLNDPAQLAEYLKYHVISGKIMSADLSDKLEATTLEGKAVKFTVTGNNIKVNDSNITSKDIETANGVIHVINAMMIVPVK